MRGPAAQLYLLGRDDDLPDAARAVADLHLIVAGLAGALQHVQQGVALDGLHP